MKYKFELEAKELPKCIYNWMIDEHKKSWCGQINISKNNETNRGVSVACDDGFDPEKIFPYRNGTGYWY